MALTSQQKTTLKAHIDASGDLNVFPNNSDGAFAIAALLNLPSAPAFIVWRTDIPTSDVKKAIVWTEYIGRSAGERDAFVLMTSNGIVNAADANNRQGFLDIFSGPSGAVSRANLTALAKRTATRGEAVLATGTGSDASPGTLTFQGAISFADVQDARNS